MPASDQILTVAQMGAAEEALIDGGETVASLMERAGTGAAEWVWRVAAHRPVTVLCGPGNNGGDGYVIARELARRGSEVTVVAALEPRTEAAVAARASYPGAIAEHGHGGVLVDCLFGSGLTRPLSDAHMALLNRLTADHRHAIAIDLPSGVESDSGALLNPGLPRFDLTIALGAWKFAHWLMPACATLGATRLVDIGVEARPGAATALRAPQLRAPLADAHKYRRGLLAVVGGAMPGAALLAAMAAQGAGAGYVKLFAEQALGVPADIVLDTRPLAEVLTDERIAALLVGPGLGRDQASAERLLAALGVDVPAVVDADGLPLLLAVPIAGRTAPIIVTPHEGELVAMERNLRCPGTGSKVERALALATASGLVVVAKGPDTVIAAPDGRVACAPRASAWLSTAGTGDVLAGVIASRLAAGVDAFAAACEGVWIHGEAARRAGPAFTASELARHVGRAYAAAL
jgi:hydroxyethylthiazole kinase-like uncharacterized protein yjeF